MFAVYGGIKLRKKKVTVENNMEQLENPRIVVIKDESKLSVHGNSCDMWELCGFEPYAGPKVVRWVCLYPESVCVSRFFSGITDKWKANSFGYFEPVPILTHTGFFPISQSNDVMTESSWKMEVYDSYLAMLSN
jgi:hypothetical protein